jgi:hypothetical protein
MAVKQRQSVSSKMRSVSNTRDVNSNIKSSDISLPTDQQSRLAQTIQTHNAVSVGASGSSDSSWIDCDGFDRLALTMKNDASTNSQVYLYWSNDGTNSHGYEQFIVTSTAAYKQAETPIKARFVKVQLLNGDAASHTMSAWVYLKV